MAWSAKYLLCKQGSQGKAHAKETQQEHTKSLIAETEDAVVDRESPNPARQTRQKTDFE